jgi:hypothetical protein
MKNTNNKKYIYVKVVIDICLLCMSGLVKVVVWKGSIRYPNRSINVLVLVMLHYQTRQNEREP